MKRALYYSSLIVCMFIVACKRNNAVIPVSGTIGGKPAVSLYGNSHKPSDYVLIDTAAADLKVLYDGVVFSYHYTSGNTIYMVYNNVPAVQASLSLTQTNVVLTIIKVYNTVTFGSAVYTSI